MTVEKQPSRRPDMELPEVKLGDGIDEDAAIASIIAHMKMAGGCIVRNLLSRATVDQIVGELQPYLSNKDTELKSRQKTLSVTGLPSKSETFTTEVVGNRIWHGVIDHFLTRTFGPYWMGDEQVSHTGKPQLSATVTFLVTPGAEDQGLHRDDLLHYNWQGPAQEYVLGRDVMSVMFMALSETTKANGATRVIPGSHLWDYSLPPDEAKAVYVEMQPGDAFISLGSIYHAGSANTTVDQNRLVSAVSSIRTELRQEENAYLTYSKEDIMKLPVFLQEFFGYTIGKPILGNVDMKDPLQFYNPDVPTERLM